MKLTWLTDIHLNFLDSMSRIAFYQSIINANSDALLITGDIAEAASISQIMIEMKSHIKKPIYFVLGNHDYYQGQVNKVRDEVRRLCKNESLLHWLPSSAPQVLDENTILLGQDGWADGRLGDYQNSPVSLNDSRLIRDLFLQKIIGKQQLLDKMQQLADADAEQLGNDLKQAVTRSPKKIIVLTHVPPFKEACMHEGKISNDDFLPFFASKVTGDVLSKFASENPAIDFMVLCGHTHSAGICRPLNNLLVRAGKAEYYKPAIQDIIEV